MEVMGHISQLVIQDIYDFILFYEIYSLIMSIHPAILAFVSLMLI